MASLTGNALAVQARTRLQRAHAARNAVKFGITHNVLSMLVAATNGARI